MVLSASAVDLRLACTPSRYNRSLYGLCTALVSETGTAHAATSPSIAAKSLPSTFEFEFENSVIFHSGEVNFLVACWRSFHHHRVEGDQPCVHDRHLKTSSGHTTMSPTPAAARKS
eukprot:scpid7096/ scgid14756/ 